VCAEKLFPKEALPQKQIDSIEAMPPQTIAYSKEYLEVLCLIEFAR
jgi:hypothetical protein